MFDSCSGLGDESTKVLGPLQTLFLWRRGGWLLLANEVVRKASEVRSFVDGCAVHLRAYAGVW